MDKVVIDLGYGDSGKGITVARLTEPGDIIVKFSGGAQAAHNVIWDGHHHTFSQFGSGMIHDDTKTYLTDKFLVDFPALLKEASHLEECGIANPLDRIVVDQDALVITGPMIKANRIDAIRNGHGSTVRGINTTVKYAQEYPPVRARHLLSGQELHSRLSLQHDWLLHNYLTVADMSFDEEFEYLLGVGKVVKISYPEPLFYKHKGNVVYEGSQGVLLDENIGFFPHVTRATTTSKNAVDFMQRLNLEGVRKINFKTYGVIRTFMTRHGAGPFVTEDHSMPHLDVHNTESRYAGSMRYGYLDLEAIRYSLKYQYVDGLVITHCDHTFPVALDAKHPDLVGKSLDERAAGAYNGYWRRYQLDMSPDDIAHRLGIDLFMKGFGPSVENYTRL